MTLARASPILWLDPLFPSQLFSALTSLKEPLLQKAKLTCPPPPARPVVGFHGLGPYSIPPGPLASRQKLFQKPQSCYKNLPFLLSDAPPPHLVVVTSFISLCTPSYVSSLRNGRIRQASANRPLRGMWVPAHQMAMGPDTSLKRSLYV